MGSIIESNVWLKSATVLSTMASVMGAEIAHSTPEAGVKFPLFSIDRPMSLISSVCAASVSALSELPGVEVHERDEATGRIVVTQEAESVDAEVEGLRRIQRLPGVISAELVYHRLSDEAAPVRPPAASSEPPAPSRASGRSKE